MCESRNVNPSRLKCKVSPPKGGLKQNMVQSFSNHCQQCEISCYLNPSNCLSSVSIMISLSFSFSCSCRQEVSNTRICERVIKHGCIFCGSTSSGWWYTHVYKPSFGKQNIPFQGRTIHINQKKKIETLEIIPETDQLALINTSQKISKPVFGKSHVFCYTKKCVSRHLMFSMQKPSRGTCRRVLAFS